MKVKGAGPPARRAAAAWRAFHDAKQAHDTAALTALRDRVRERETLFANLHHYDAALDAVSTAVFRRVRARLDEPAR